MKKRVFLIVLDSLGAGALPDAADWGDAGAHTLRSISKSPEFSIDNLRRLGLGNIDGLSFLGATEKPQAACARMAEESLGKDTTIGHWEISGLYSPKPLPTFTDGFPQELLERFSAETGRGWICNNAYSGTEVIRDYGEEHVRTGKYIVYTSVDSVFQIAAHEDVIPLEELYEACRTARRLLTGEYAVGRVIARPFTGSAPDFTRTANRRDFSVAPPGRTMLNAISEAGMECIAVGKINDIFSGSGVTESIITHGNAEGMQVTKELAQRDFSGLVFTNLVDFDMLYGHRQDVDGYAAALTRFDRWLDEFLPLLRPDDALIITADHGCDPADNSTDHTREYTPMLAYGAGIKPVNLGTRARFSDIAATITHWLGAELETNGQPMTELLEDDERQTGKVSDSQLVDIAKQVMNNAYAPYSRFKVSAALLAADGRVFTGCNIENASYGATVCAERTAFFNAVSSGVRDFSAIAIVGGKDGVITGFCPPCGVCRQVMREFCLPKGFRIILASGEDVRAYTLDELLPMSFGPDNLY